MASHAARPGPFSTGFDPGSVLPDAALGSSIIDRFLAVAEERGDATALSSPAGRWTYAELGVEVQRRAAALTALGAGPDRTVAVLLEHDGPLVVTILSVAAAGAIVVVVDPMAPADQIDHVLRESGTELLVHDEVQAPLAAAATERVAGIAAVHLAALDADPVPLPSRRGGDPVMLAFTSGTSGAPKAATITHDVLLNVVRGAVHALGITPADRMPMLFPTSLAVAAYPMFIPLLTGGTLATLDVRSVGLAPVGEFLVRERITLAYMSPTVVRFLVDAVAGIDFPDLRLLALGGEPVDREVVALASQMFRPTHLANGFGTTETGVIALFVEEAAAIDLDPVPAGWPVSDVEVLVVDDAGAPVPDGGSGEIVVVSPHLFSGYWGHPEVDRQVLGDDPQGRPGWRLYRTGDLGRVDADGRLVVAGRVDTKVKIRGRFVVLGDVEAALHAVDGLVDAAVVAVRRAGNLELCGVVAAPDGFDPRRVRAELLERYETYSVPSHWVTVDELPRLPNGKIDRQSIAALAEARVERTPDESAVSDEAVAATLTEIWTHLLGGTVPGPDDDFTELGGDSLLAAQMLILTEQRLGVTVPMSAMLQARTIGQLTQVVIELGAGDRPASSAVCVEEGAPGRPRLWFVPDLPGSAFRVRHVARHLGADEPLWSFESPLLSGDPNPYSSLDTFAATLVADLRAAQPEGPYHLAGYSFGGICAYEMARQLRRDGHEVAFLGVIDVGPGYRGPAWQGRKSPLRPWFGVKEPPPPGTGRAGAARYYAAMLRESPASTARHLMVRSGVARVVDPIRFSADLRRTGRVRAEWRLWYAWEEHWKLAARAWDRRRPYDGRVDLFWASLTGSSDSTMGWDALVADLHIHRFPCFHDDILEEAGAPALAACLRPVLDAAAGSRNLSGVPDGGEVGEAT